MKPCSNLCLLGQCLAFLGKRKWIFLFSILSFTCVDCLCLYLQTVGMKGLINGVAHADHALFLHSAWLLGIRAVLWLFYAPLSSYLCDWASKSAVARLNARLAEHMLRLPLHTHDAYPTGELLSVFTSGVSSLSKLYDGDIFFAVNSFFTGLAAFVLMVFADWRFAVAVLLLGWCSFALSGFVGRRMGDESSRHAESLAQFNAKLHALVRNQKTIRCLFLEQQQKERYAAVTQEERGIRERLGFLHAQLRGAQSLISALGTLLVLTIGALLVRHRLTDWGTVAALIGIKGATDALLVRFSGHLASMRGSLRHIKRIVDALELSPESDADYFRHSIRADLFATECLLRTQALGFAYSKDTHVLNNLALTLKRGEITAVIGPNGSGKSTLAKILLALYPAQEGVVFYAGKAAPERLLERLRMKIAYVPQEPMLFAGSVYENIRCGRENATFEDVLRAAKAAQADAFIQRLPQGFQTQLTDLGGNLSGGQRQRIAIARALLKGAPILLCDEITASLEADASSAILSTLQSLKSKYAIVMITHASSVTQIADHFITMS